MRLLTFFFFASVFGLTVTAHARDYKAGSLDIADLWSRATPKGSSVAAGYMKIKNTGSTSDRLVSGSSEVAAKFEVHEMTMENGIAKMRPVKGGLEIKPGDTVELKPGSFHVMFVDLKTPLAAGDHRGLLACAWRLTVWSPVHGPREPTPGYVKLLLPPRQSRGNSLVGLAI